MRSVALVLLLWLTALIGSGTHAATVSVIGRACVPNAYEPARACTLHLDAPGNHLVARGLRMFAQPEALPDSNGEFSDLPFGPDDYFFDQVNVFWHAQRHLERLERYGLDLAAHPVLVRVQAGAGSFTHFTEPVSTIGTGLNGVDQGAKDGDIIVHEITHAVFNPRMPLGSYVIDKGESIPVLEGIADYFAAAVNGDTRIAEFARPPAGYHDIRTDPAVYHYDRWDLLPADPYSRGKVLNGALLEIHDVLGETADELVFGATDHAPLRCFTCFADAVRWADVERYGGAHLATIDSAFARRGIPSGPPIDVRIDTPAWTWLGEDITATLRHTCGAGPFEVAWRVRDALGNVEELPSRTDQVVYRATRPVTFEATMRDRNGVEYAPAPVTVTTYDPADPNLNVSGVSISGPAQIPPGFITSFSYALLGGAGVPPRTALWTADNAQLSPPQANGTTVGVLPFANPVRLNLTYRDASGQIARDSLTILVLQPLIGGPISGPAILPEGETADYFVRVDGGLRPYQYWWSQVSPSGSVSLPDSATVRSLPATTDFTLRVTVTDAAGRSSATTTLAVRKLVPLALDPIAGPTALPAGQSGQFSSTPVGGHSPFHYQWYQVGPGGTFRLADARTVASVPETGDFELQLIASDAAGSNASRSQRVHVTGLLQIGSIDGPASVVAGQGAVFRVSLQGGTPPYRYQWSQQVDLDVFALGDSSQASARPADRDYWVSVAVRDARDALRVASRLVPVTPAPPPPASRSFRVLGNVLRRGSSLTLELPTPDAPGELVVMDASGRVRASGPVGTDTPATLSVNLPQNLDSGIYFVRLRRSDRTWTARFIVIAR